MEKFPGNMAKLGKGNEPIGGIHCITYIEERAMGVGHHKT
jgi:hypothetical protein